MNQTLNVVIAGTGVGALETALAIDEMTSGHVAITLVGPDPYLHYRPLAVRSPFDGRPVPRFSIGAIAADRSFAYVRDAVTAVDVDQRLIDTAEQGSVSFDVLVMATGAIAGDVASGTVPFRGPQDVERFGHVLVDLRRGGVRRIAFVVPPGAAWPLPAYELALQTAGFVAEHDLDVEVTLVTPERRPLAAFGAGASAVVAEKLEAAGVAVRLEVRATDAVTSGFSALDDRVVCLPVVHGRQIPGLPATPDGFLEVDASGRLRGQTHVYAVGDVTARRFKQGGLTAEQADAVASTIAALAGADVAPFVFQPVLRGLLVTGGEPLYLLHDPDAGVSRASTQPLWSPPHKIFGLRLAPYLESNDDLAVGTAAPTLTT